MPTAPKFAIGMEPTEAIEFLRQKKMLAGKVFTNCTTARWQKQPPSRGYPALK